LIYLGITFVYLFIGIRACSKIPDGKDGAIDLKSYLHEEDLLEEAA
jgi:hypothetical protein